MTRRLRWREGGAVPRAPPSTTCSNSGPPSAAGGPCVGSPIIVTLERDHLHQERAFAFLVRVSHQLPSGRHRAGVMGEVAAELGWRCAGVGVWTDGEVPRRLSRLRSRGSLGDRYAKLDSSMCG
jgi:hypothetical protein